MTSTLLSPMRPTLSRPSGGTGARMRTMYDERLGVPLRWWALATMFLASLLIAFLVATPLWLLASGVLVALTVGVLVGYGAARVTVKAGVLSAGRARISVRHLGDVTA